MMKTLRQNGFTLMEVMISMLIMTIAFFAILMTQGTALDGYGATRDGTAAAEVGNSVIELMQLEGMQWRTGCFNTAAPSNTYATGSTPFDIEQLLVKIQEKKWAWLSLHAAPVDVRLASGSSINGRFCVFARGDFRKVDLDDTNSYDTTTNDFQCSPVFQSQIAVVYAGPNGNLTSCDTIATTDFTPESTDALELKGLRVSYFGTVVMRREWLVTP